MRAFDEHIVGVVLGHEKSRIEAGIRESIAREIETQTPEMGCDINITDYRRGRWSGMTDSARIARGETDQ